MINPRAQPCDEATIRAAPADRACMESRKPWILAVTIMASTMAYLDESAVNVALPAIESDLKATVEVVQWLVNAYMLSLGAFLLIGGAAADRFGRRRIFVLGTAIFAAASLWCGVAPGTGQLFAARVVQGIGAALLIPCSLAIIGASFAESERGKAIGTWAGSAAIASAVAPILGGYIVDHATWRWIFLINPFLAVAAIWIAIRFVPESRDPDAPPGLDWLGAMLAFAGLGAVIFGLIGAPGRGWRDPIVLASLLTGSLLLAGFVWVEKHNAAPMLPLSLFRSRTFSGVNLLTLLLYAALGGAFFFLPFDLIQVHGYTATAAGTVFLPFTFIMGVLARWSGGLLDRYGARLPLIVGPVISAVGFALFAWLHAGASFWTTFFPPFVVLGIGMAITVAPLTTTVINAAPVRQAGAASGINNAVASVANLLAVALFGALALAAFDRGLDRRLGDRSLTPEIAQAVERARGTFVIAPVLAGVASRDRATVESIVKQSLADSIRLVMLAAAALALAGAACAAATIPPSAVGARAAAPQRVSS